MIVRSLPLPQGRRRHTAPVVDGMWSRRAGPGRLASTLHCAGVIREPLSDRRVSMRTMSDVTSDSRDWLDDGGLPVLVRTGEGDGLGGRCRGVGGAVR